MEIAIQWIRVVLPILYSLLPAITSHVEWPTIRPIPCSNSMTGESGVCTFNWSCANVAHGVHIGPCMDRFFVGSCCKISPDNETRLSHHDATKTEMDSKVYPTVASNTEDKEIKKPSTISLTTNPLNHLFVDHDAGRYESKNQELEIVYDHEVITSQRTSHRYNLTISLPTVSHNPILSGSFLHALLFPENGPAETITEAYRDRSRPFTSSDKTKDKSGVLVHESSAFNFGLPYRSHSSALNDNKKPPVVPQSHHYLREPVRVHETHNQRKQVLLNEQHDLRRPVPRDEAHNQRWPVLEEDSHNQRRPVPLDEAHDQRWPVLEEDWHNQRRPVLEDGSNDQRWPVLEEDSHNQRLPVNSLHWIGNTGGDKNRYPFTSTASAYTTPTTKNPFSSIQSTEVNPTETSQNLPFQSQIPSQENFNSFSTVPTTSVLTTSNEEDSKIINVSQDYLNLLLSTVQFPESDPTNDQIARKYVSKVCGRPVTTTTGRIVGGKKAHYLRWPWMISLRRFEQNAQKHKCGATLLNKHWAITAAHCVEDNFPMDAVLRLGEYNFRRSDEEHPHVERLIKTVVIHPKFNPITFENDLALLKFHEPVELQANIIPVCLPHAMDDITGRMAVVTGWGKLSTNGELPETLHEVQMPILSNEDCQLLYYQAGFAEHIQDVFVCAGLSSGGMDSCEGDSGGPMVIRGDEGEWILVGLISWGMGCAKPKQPGVYTRMTEFTDWIDSIIWQ